MTITTFINVTNVKAYIKCTDVMTVAVLIHVINVIRVKKLVLSMTSRCLSIVRPYLAVSISFVQ
jgi:hypothetical protein